MSGDWRTRLWDWVRGQRHHRCGWHGPIRCDAILGPDDPPVCPTHNWLPDCKQRFWRDRWGPKPMPAEEDP
jgi:hypothetical protein